MKNVVSCNRQGRRIEQVFYRTAQRQGIEIIRQSNTYEDVYEHWDVLVKIDGKEYRVDVKDQRKRQRYDKMLRSKIVVEWKNVQGWSGWIYGCADIIAFRVGEYFHLIPREQLMEYALQIVDFDKQVGSFAECVNCVYSRIDRDDLMSLIDISCIPFEYNIIKIGER